MQKSYLQVLWAIYVVHNSWTSWCLKELNNRNTTIITIMNSAWYLQFFLTVVPIIARLEVSFGLSKTSDNNYFKTISYVKFETILESKVKYQVEIMLLFPCMTTWEIWNPYLEVFQSIITKMKYTALGQSSCRNLTDIIIVTVTIKIIINCNKLWNEINYWLSPRWLSTKLRVLV